MALKTCFPSAATARALSPRETPAYAGTASGGDLLIDDFNFFQNGELVPTVSDSSFIYDTRTIDEISQG
ncbi:MAG: hypothetical protein GY929_01850 [Actinomycetia bacterium]|nr:hypothetical protein [Actinomycetes bacterium]